MEQRIEIKPDGTVLIYCASADQLVQVVRGLGLTKTSPIKAYTEAPLLGPDIAKEAGFSVSLKQLLKLVAGSSQEKYLQLLRQNPDGVIISDIVNAINLKNNFAFAGVWSGLVRNCKRLDINIEYLVKKEKDKIRGVVHKPADEFLTAWKQLWG